MRNVRRRGFTLVEVVIALAVTAMAVAGMSGMLYAIAHGTQNGDTALSDNVRAQVMISRLRATIHNSYRILAYGSNYLVLWTSDTNADGKPNVSEMRRIEWSSAQSRLWYYAPASSLASDPSYALTSDFNTITAALEGTASFPATLWGDSVSAIAIRLDQSAAQSATCASIDVTFSDAPGTPLRVVAGIQ
ncbi:MAG: prepilin-type N-terminal cleavage/methylation domain-containing protein [Planctomycetota bacterium]|nr:prepilin-type N-terminal cleavage/methylation domain-containing protein [Planctomycetota bacterium]